MHVYYNNSLSLLISACGSAIVWQFWVTPSRTALTFQLIPQSSTHKAHTHKARMQNQFQLKIACDRNISEDFLKLSDTKIKKTSKIVFTSYRFYLVHTKTAFDTPPPFPVIHNQKQVNQSVWSDWITLIRLPVKTKFTAKNCKTTHFKSPALT